MSNKEITLIEGDVKIIASLEPSIYGTGKLDIDGDLTVSGTIVGSVVATHSGLTGLTNDDHTQYALLAGRSGGQTFTGGTAASNLLTIRSTSNATKGSIFLDETTSSISNSTGSLTLLGSIGISNTTDAISSTNGGTFTTAGGLSVAKRVFIGTDLNVSGTATISSLVAPHSGLTGLTNDDHTQYALLTGRSGGQTLIGGTAASNILTIRSTSNVTKGSILLDETTNSTSNSSGSLRLLGGIGINNTTDAVSSTNGGTFTTAGGLSVAKKVFIGTDLSVTGTATITNLIAPHSGLSGLISADDHTQYSLLIGRTGGQTLIGGIAASNNLTLRSTSSGVKGSIILDETTSSISNSTGSLKLAGGIGISNTTDAVSSTNGGTFTTAGGLSVAKKAFIGTDLSVGGTATFNSLVAPHSTLSGLSNDDHNQYALLSGRSGGQILISGDTANDNLILRSTVNPTKGSVILDETTTSINSTSGSLRLAGGIGISNTTDAISSTNGGTFTTAGGLSVAKKVFIGTDLNVSGTATITSLVAPHSTLSGLISGDDHTQYALLQGRSGGQTFTGGTSASNTLTIRSTSNATKGSVFLDETTPTTSNSTGSLRLAGGIGISNTTDATSSTNGGTFTTAGGLSVAKKVFIGTDLNVAGTATISSLIAPHSTLSGLTSGDDHTQYTLLQGRSGGQTLTGGTAASNTLTIRSTSDATKGSVFLDEATVSINSTSGALRLSGGIGISNTTDATSSTNGGTFTTAGGVAIGKQVFIGTNLIIQGNTSSTSNSTGSLITVGGIGISNTTDATSSTNGGTITTAGGIAIAKQAFVGTNLIIQGNTSSTSSLTGSLRTVGGIGISNSTDATSSTNGGTITTAGGIAIAKQAFIGTSLNVIGPSILSNYFQNTAISEPNSPIAGNIRIYTDTNGQLLKSKSSTGIITTYQPTNTKGDLLTHNGTTQVRLPTDVNNKILVTNSATTSGLEWQTLGSLLNYYVITYQLSTGTNGGTNIASVWTDRQLNTIVPYPLGTTRITLSGNDMIFTEGTYLINITASFYRTETSMLRLFNNTDSTIIYTGESGYAKQDQSTSIDLRTIFTITGTKTIKLQYFTSASQNNNGLGRATGIPSVLERYVSIIVNIIN